MDHINVTILIMILYYGFAECYHEGKLEKVYKGSLYIISYNCV